MRTGQWITLIWLFCAVGIAARADDSSPATTTGGGGAAGGTEQPAATPAANPLAVDADSTDLLGKKPMSFAVGPFDLSPMVQVSESYDDNMFFNNRNRKGSMLTQVRLGLQLELKHGPNRYDVQYGFRSWSWHSSPTDDYLDQFVGGKAHVEFTSRNKLDFRANYIDSHNLRGTYFTAPGLPFSQIAKPDTFHEYNAEIRYLYGVATAQGNLELIAGVNDLTYDTRPEVMSTFNKTRIYAIPGFYYRVMPKTRLLAQVEATWYKYHESSSAAQYDYNLQRYLIGAKWQATAMTSGTLRLGYMTQQFENNTPGSSGFSGDLSMEWTPLTYSRFNLNLSRNIVPTIGYGTSAIVNSVSAGWTHDWNSRLRTHLNAGYFKMDNKNVETPGVNSNQVTSDYYNASVGVDYSLKSWVSVGLSYTYRGLSSSYNVQNYDQNLVMLYVTFNPFAAAQTSAPWSFNFGPGNYYNF